MENLEELYVYPEYFTIPKIEFLKF